MTDSGVLVSGCGFRVSDFGFRVSDFEFRVPGFGFRGSDYGYRRRGRGEYSLERRASLSSTSNFEKVKHLVKHKSLVSNTSDFEKEERDTTCLRCALPGKSLIDQNGGAGTLPKARTRRCVRGTGECFVPTSGRVNSTGWGILILFPQKWPGQYYRLGSCWRVEARPNMPIHAPSRKPAGANMIRVGVLWGTPPCRMTCGPISPYSGRGCVKSLRSSYTGWYPQRCSV